jgi:predicted ATPase/DNA-binding SARP family transcriptional activator/tetratricopeptide (TPR) repeat protein
MSVRTASPSRGLGFPAAAQLPVYLTALVARAREVVEVRGLLRANRLVSLVGPGGGGKTRLAAAIATEVRGRHPGGVAWIDLGALADPDLTARHVAATLGIGEHPGRTAADSLIELFGSHAVLLVLDNCEHLLGACAVMVDALLRSCPELRVLTTSRQALGIIGEKAWPVPPLGVPAPGDAIGEAGAVQLFVERASDALPGFALTEANGPAVAHICRQLDGLPLAIELAAARVKLLPPEQIAARLDGVFGLLTSSSRTTLPRHRTMRALIDWSYDLLCTDERLLLERLAVFSGGFSLEAAESVAADDRLPAAEILDLLAALIDRSLVSMRETGGEARYVLLEVVRHYAGDRYAGRDDTHAADRLHRRHADYFAGFAENVAGRLQQPGQLEWLSRLEPEHDNVRAAIGWSIDAGETDLALRLCVAMRDFWRLRGHLSEGVRWIDGALALPSGSATLRTRALVGAAVLERMQGEYLALRDRLAEGERIARSGGDRYGLAEVLTHLGTSLRDRNELAAAAERLDEAIALWRELGDTKGLTLALGVRASICLARKETAPARALRLEGVEVARRTGDREDEARSLLGLGEVARLEGDLDGAGAYYRRSLALFEELGDHWHIAATHHNLGWVEAETGDLEAAYQHFSGCIGDFRGAGNPFGLTLCLFGFARILHDGGDAESAAVALAAADAESARVGVLPAAAADIACCARTRAAIESALEAERLEVARERGARLDLAAGLKYAQETLDLLLRDRSGSASDRPDRTSRGGSLAPTVLPPAASGADLPVDLGVSALGPLRIFLGDRPLEGDAFGSSKPRELLLLLLLHHPHGCTREQVGLAFWPDSSAAQVKNSFHVTLHRLRKALERPDWIVSAGDRYRLDPGVRVDFDAARFEAEVRAAIRASDEPDAVARLASALADYRGDFLEGELVADWHLEVRDDLRRLYHDGSIAIADLLMQQERFEEAGGYLRALLARDRLHEDACRRLMICQARTGARTEALRSYESLAVLLRDEMNADPDQTTRELYERLQRAETV